MKTIARLAVVLATVVMAGASGSPAEAAAKPAAPAARTPKKPRVLVTISKETTYITKPLRPDGYPDYIAALNEWASKGVTPENNAAVPLWRAFGPAEINKALRQTFFKLLGIPPLPEKGDYFVSLEASAKQPPGTGKPPAPRNDEQLGKVYDELDRAMKGPWSKKDCPTVAAWMEANRKPLGLIFQATKRPRRYDPLVAAGEPAMVISVLLPGLQQQRGAARALVARAMLRLGEGKLDEAWADLLACHRLARLSAQGPTLIDALVGIAIDGIACRGDEVLLQHARLTATQARRMQQDLGRLPPMSNMADRIDVAERFMFLDCVTMVAREGIDKISSLDGGGGEPSKVVKSLLNLAARLTIDWDTVLRMGNSWYDRMVAAFRKPTRAERQKALGAIDRDIKSLATEARDFQTVALAALGNPRKAITQETGKILIALLLPAISAASDAEDRGAMQFEVTRLGFALAAYHADHGAYPARLDELAPKYVAQVPEDIFNAEPLHYKRKDNGYLLYSIGRNGKDDGGRGYDDREKAGGWGEHDWDDLSVRVPAEEQET